MEIDPFCQPSLPLIKKWRAPHLACVALFYSEDTEEVYHVFPTDNLHQSLATKSRFQSAALRKDPTVRVCWIDCHEQSARTTLTEDLRTRFDLAVPDPVDP